MRIIQHDQGSPEWLAWRAGGVGGSDAPSIMGVGFHTPADLWYQKKGILPGPVDNVAMERGRRLEPEAREWVADYLSTDLEPICLEHDTIAWLKASLDGYGLSGKAAFACEIKVPGRSVHTEAAQGIVCKKYWPQVQHQLMAMDNEADMYFVSYYVGTVARPEPPDVKVVHVIPDLKYQKILFEQEQLFIQSLSLDRCPYDAQDLRYVSPAVKKAVKDYVDLMLEAERISRRMKPLKALILDNVPDGRLDGLVDVVTKTRRGSIPEARLAAVLSTMGIDPASLREPDKEERKIELVKVYARRENGTPVSSGHEDREG